MKGLASLIAFPSTRRGSQPEGVVSTDPSSNQLRLPLELILEILLYLKDDIGSLSACSLVSWGWYIETRRMFYHRISVEICKIRYSSRVTPPRSSALRTETFVREIRLYSKYASYYRDTSLSAVARFLRRFPSLETVTVCSLNWDLRSEYPSCWDWTRPRPSITLPSVRRIRMVYQRYLPAFNHLSAFLNWFPRLEELEFLKDTSSGSSLIHHEILQDQSYVQIHVDCSQSSIPNKYNAGKIVRRLTSLFSLSFSAPVLALDLEGASDIENAALVLNEVGPNLVELTVKTTTQVAALQGDKTNFYSSLDFSVCASLQTLNVILNLSSPPQENHLLIASWNHLLHILSLVITNTHRTLSNISITLVSKGVPDHMKALIERNISKQQWGRMQDLFLSLGEERLERVEFKEQGLGHGFASRMSGKLGRMLPKIKQRGMLHISSS